MTDYFEALYSTLSTDVDVPGRAPGGIHPIIAEPVPAGAYLTISETGIEGDNAHNEYTEGAIDVVTMQVTAWSRTFDAARQLRNVTRIALQGKVLAGGAIAVTLSSGFTTYDWQAKLFGFALVFTLTVKH